MNLDPSRTGGEALRVRQRFVVALTGYAGLGQREYRYVGIFRSIRTAERWATANAYDNDGHAYRWSVEPLESPDE